MSKQFFSMIAAAAFLLSIGSAAAENTTKESTAWFYVHPGTNLPDEEVSGEPNCIESDLICAMEFLLDEDGNPTAPTNASKPGKRIQ